MEEEVASRKISIDLQFIVVYIAEAHATNEWPVASARYNFNEVVSVEQTCTMPSRASVACGFFKRFSYDDRWKLFVAEPEEECTAQSGYGFEAIFKPWPFRVFGFVGDILDYISEPHAAETRIMEIREWLYNTINTFN